VIEFKLICKVCGAEVGEKELHEHLAEHDMINYYDLVPSLVVNK